MEMSDAVKKDNAIYPKLGKNIRGLREAWGETQTDLALILGAKGPNTISNYESGERTPSPEFMQRLSKHYHVSEHNLKYGDFEHLPDLTKISACDENHGVEIILKLFPIFCTPKAMEDNNFSKAYIAHQNLLETMRRDGELAETEIDLCLSLYQTADRNGIEEATANHLSLLFLFGFLTVLLTPRLVDMLEIFDDWELTFNNFMGSILPSFGEIEDVNDFDTDPQRLEFLKEYEAYLLVDIARLQHSAEYSDLGNYYFALRYLFNLLTTNSFGAELNAAVGSDLLFTYSLMQNKYCKSFLGET